LVKSTSGAQTPTRRRMPSGPNSAIIGAATAPAFIAPKMAQ
jgi:hypothetical protein